MAYIRTGFQFGNLTYTDVASIKVSPRLSASLDGVATVVFDLAPSGVTPGTYSGLVVDSFGRVVDSLLLVAVGDVGGSMQSGTFTLSLAASGVSPGVYNSVVVNAKGIVTAASNVAYVAASSLGTTNGVATLDGSGKLTAAQIPASLLGAVVYHGVWDANANVPSFASGFGTKGSYYKVSVAGQTVIDNNGVWNAGDFIIFNGTTWDRIQGGAGLDQVITVNAQTGNVVISTITGNAGSATKLASPRNLIMNGDVTAQAVFDGSNDATFTVSLLDSGVLAGTYTSFVVDSKGRVTQGLERIVTGDVYGSAASGASINLLLATVTAPGTFSNLVIDQKGRVITARPLSASDITSGLNYVPLSPSLMGAPNGVATLDNNGKLSSSQVSAALSGIVIFKGTWDASTNTPPLSSGTGSSGWLYIVKTAGTTNLDGNMVWAIGDELLFDGALNQWTRLLGGSEVVSVNGQEGEVSITTITGNAGTASKLATPVQIAIAGSMLGSASFDGSSDITINTAMASSGIGAGTYNTVVLDSTGLLTGASIAPYLTSNQTITLTGDATGSGTNNIAVTLAATGAWPGTYNTVVVNSKGQVTSATNTAYLTAALPINVTGDVSGSAVTTSYGLDIGVILSNTGVAAGSYSYLCVDVHGRALSGTNLSFLGDVSGTATSASVTLSLAQIATPGTFSNVVIDATGRVRSARIIVSADVTGALGFTPANAALIGATGGLATLDGTGKLTTGQLPASVVGAVVYQGVWNPNTNMPSLTSGQGTKGWYYKVSVTGTFNLDGIVQWNAGDLAIFDGTTWDKVDGLASEVLSVNGQTGAVSVTSVTGNAGSATALQTPQPIALAGDATGTASFSGSSGATITATLAAVGSAGTYIGVVTDPKGRVISGAPLTTSGDVSIGATGPTALVLTLVNSGVTAGNYSNFTVDSKGRLTSARAINNADVTTALGYTPLSTAGGTVTGTLVAEALTTGSLAITGTVNVGTSGVGTINVPTINATGTVTAASLVGPLIGNASTASALATARTLALNGDVLGSAAFDGSANSTIGATLANVGTAATYAGVVTDTKGRVVSGYRSNVVMAEIGTGYITGTITPGNSAPSVSNANVLWSASFTPQSINSRVVIEFTCMVDCSSSAAYISVVVVRGSTQIGMTVVRVPNNGNSPQTIALRMFDLPNSTSPQSYTAYIGTQNSFYTVYVNRMSSYTLGGIAGQHTFRISEDI